MQLLHSRPPYNFGGIWNPEYKKSKVVVLPVPYDSTSSYGGGARNGPHAIISASRNMEWFDEELDCEIATQAGFWTLDELEPDMRGPREMTERVQQAVSQILAEKKFPLMLGGEHSITPGAVAAVAKKFKNLSVLQFDAHADLRDEYEGTKHNHACAMRRCRELVNDRVVQVGIRSYSKEERDFIKQGDRRKRIFGPSFNVRDIIPLLSENVYVTIDVDCFDPALVPGTGTPEPDGLQWGQVINLLRFVAKERSIVGADVVELAPVSGLPAGDFLCAKLAYKLAGYAVLKERLVNCLPTQATNCATPRRG